jgi:hypothetical protein
MILSFRSYDYGSPEYVVLHAVARQRRGKVPSATTRWERNPRVALANAWARMKRGSPGEHISNSVTRLCLAARIGRKPVIAELNGITVTAQPDSNPVTLYRWWWSEMERGRAEYEASPEYAASQAHRREEAKERAIRGNALLQSLPSAIEAGYVAVMDWIAQLQPITDYIGVDLDVAPATATLIEAGYAPSVNCGEDFREDDPENFARYVIGQGLSYMTKGGPIHPIYPSFAEKWHDRFDPKT